MLRPNLIKQNFEQLLIFYNTYLTHKLVCLRKKLVENIKPFLLLFHYLLKKQ